MYLGYCLNSYALAPRYILERKIHQNHITVWRLEIRNQLKYYFISYLRLILNRPHLKSDVDFY